MLLLVPAVRNAWMCGTAESVLHKPQLCFGAFSVSLLMDILSVVLVV